ncbi:hypothetical protein PENTCL1PPCAC_23854, partial [Pristionchus entomophagus]
QTGRTTDGEYFLPYSAHKRHYLLVDYYNLELLHRPTSKLMRKLEYSMRQRGLYSSLGFTRDTILMHSFFGFLPPELARIVMQGVRLGITAHVIYLVAEMQSRIKFIQVAAKMRGIKGGPSEKKSTIDKFAHAMDRLTDGEGDREGVDGMPDLYKGAGDSVAIADFLVRYGRINR